MEASKGTRSDDFLECDVLVIGSGPAGASVAYHLTRLGKEDVIVLERLSEKQHRRYHSICGEAVSDRAMGRAGISTDRILRRVDSIEISLGDSSPARVKVKGSIVERWAMIEDILASSKARRVRGNARHVRRLPEGGFEVEATTCRIRCRTLVGADGAYSVVRKDLFGTRPECMDPIVNTVVPGEPGDALRFFVGEVPGAYTWNFPSSEGMRSVGFPKGFEEIGKDVVHGARCIPSGRIPKVCGEGCLLVGDAAGLANPLCYGGIGAALLSGRKAAEAVVSGDLQGYGRWIDKDRMFDRRFMEMHREFTGWSTDEIEDALSLLSGNVNIFKGLVAMLRRPKYSRMYLAVWLGFRVGW